MSTPFSPSTATTDAATTDAATIAIVGAGPRGVGLLERISASAGEFLAGRRLVVHLVDPHPPGPGRVWRFDQPPLLRMNSMPEDVTMFTDETVRCDGPIRPGPTLAEWIEQVRTGQLDAHVDPAIAAELDEVTPTTFPTRRLQSAYLDWFFRRVLAELPSSVDVRVHRATAVDLTGPADGPQELWLRTQARPLLADLAVLTVGHLDALPDEDERELEAFAVRHRLRYVPPAYTADLDLSAIQPGETVLLRGFGLAFIDLMVLLAEGRGGRFTTNADGTDTYHPSGAEPRLYVGSRRGVPYHAKPEYRLCGTAAALPRFFGPEEVAELIKRPGAVDFFADLWPLMAKEIGWGYYSELFTGHPDRVRLDFDEFGDRYAELDWDSHDMRTLVEKAVPEQVDRLDLRALDRPLRDIRFPDGDAFAGHMRRYIEDDLARRASSKFSADLGAFRALLSVFGQLAGIADAGKFTSESQLTDVDGWWFGFFSFFASGPPGHRLQELLALHQAGIVEFVGPDMWVRPDDRSGRFVGGSPAVPGIVTATTLIEARLPDPSVTRASDPLIRALHLRGELSEEMLRDAHTERSTGRIHTSAPNGRLVDTRGRPHPRRFALGPHTSTRAPGAFARPRSNAPGFRQSDALAREILGLLHYDEASHHAGPTGAPLTGHPVR